MFFQFKKINNESGLVLFIVLMTAIVIMVFSLSILTQSMNEINYAQQQIEQLASEQWSKGIFWNAYSNSYFDSGQNVGTSTVIDGTVYQMFINNTGGTYNFSTNYDTSH